MTSQILTPRLIRFGRGAVRELPEVLKQLGASRPLLVTDRQLATTPIFASVKTILDDAGIGYGVFSETVPDPDLNVIAAGVNAFQGGSLDSLIGFGGGSALDTAKAINLSLHSDEEITRWRVPNVPTMPVLPLVCIPTTAGTGSEVTCGIALTDPATKEKMVFMGSACLAAAAIVDADLARTMPFRVAADTGLDALTHALEAYVSRKANIYTDTLALGALRLIGENIEAACRQRDDLSCERMMFGAMQAGMAFSNASVALVHGMSRPLGTFFKIPHGMSNAMLLAEVTAFSVPSAAVRYATCARALGAARDTDSDDVACTRLVDWLRDLARSLDVPTFTGLGIQSSVYREAIPTMVEQALASGSPSNNPGTISAAQVHQLYLKVWC